MSLNSEQIKIIQTEVESAIKYLERKKSLELIKQIEAQIPDMELSAPKLFQDFKKILTQLKWVACPLIRDDREFFKLARESFLEGLEIEGETDILTFLVSEKLALQFGVGLSETLRGLLQALRENPQLIGSNPIVVKNENKPARPIIRHWLIDFLRNTASENPTEIEEANYLFNNPNAKALSESDKKILGRVLAFYNAFCAIERELSRKDIRGRTVSPPEEEATRSTITPVSPSTNAPSLIRKPLRVAAQENKEVLNQLLTTAPIKIAGFEQPMPPTIKNWLTDYIKQKGTERHDFLERSNYLFNNSNVKSLPEKEREMVIEILKSYDNDSPLPFDGQSKLIVIEKLSSPETQIIPTPPQAPPAQHSSSIPKRDTYREPINKDDLIGPQKPLPRPAPRIDGNIIDLKDLEQR